MNENNNSLDLMTEGKEITYRRIAIYKTRKWKMNKEKKKVKPTITKQCNEIKRIIKKKKKKGKKETDKNNVKRTKIT